MNALPVALITGGAGFIGSTLAQRLVNTHRVRLLDSMHRNALEGTGLDTHPNVELVRGDVCDRETVRAAMRDAESVYHLASIAGVGTVLHHPVRTMRVAIQGTFEVFDAAVAMPRPPRLVAFSTSEVYGRQARQVRESDDTPVGPVSQSRWTYASAKLAVEHLAHAFGREFGLEVATIRPFNVYGPRQVGEGAIHNFVKRAIAGEPLVVYNDGAQIRSWAYVDDVVDGAIAA
jgi:nucleoside-diphosphate-sugar epimerase